MFAMVMYVFCFLFLDFFIILFKNVHADYTNMWCLVGPYMYIRNTTIKTVTASLIFSMYKQYINVL